MATTYTLIDKSILTTTTASVSFTSIPSTYTDLVVMASPRSDENENGTSFRIYFNDDTTASVKELRGTGSATASYSLSYAQAGYISALQNTSDTFANLSIYIPNYAGSNYKSFSGDIVSENNGSVAYAVLSARLWESTSAINKITMLPSGSNFVSGSSFYLYGIKNS